MQGGTSKASVKRYITGENIMIKYKAFYFSIKIKKVEVKRETEKSVWLNTDCKKAKNTQCYGYFESWDDAKKAIINVSKNKLVSAQEKLQIAQIQLDNINGMKEPEN
jgi:hypothetical protein